MERLIDRVRYTILKAPNRFPADTGVDLQKAFALLEEEMHESRQELATHYEEVRSSLGRAFVAYQGGQIKEGIRMLQEVDDLLRRWGTT